MAKKSILTAILFGAALSFMPLSVSANASIFTDSVSMDLKKDISKLDYETVTSNVKEGERDYLYKKRGRTEEQLPIYYYRPGRQNILTIHYEGKSIYPQRKTVQLRNFSLTEYNTKTGAERTLKNETLSCIGQDLSYHYLIYNGGVTEVNTTEGIGNLFAGGNIKRDTDSVTWDMKFFLTDAADNVPLKYTPAASMAGPLYMVETQTKGSFGENAFYIVPDSRAPKAEGADAFNDIRDGFTSWDEPIKVVIKFTDDGSGFSDGKIVIKNKDSGETKIINVTENNPDVEIVLDEDDPLYSGETEIIITAYDKVGNVMNKTYNLAAFTLTAKIESNFIPYNNVFWTGEEGRLLIDTTGFVDKLEVTFPDDLKPMYYVYDGETEEHYTYYEGEEKRLNNTFVIDLTDKQTDERTETVFFLIPDEEELAGNLYTVKVTGYKNGKSITVYPDLTVIGYSGDYSHTRVQ